MESKKVNSLVAQFLYENGYNEALAAMERESGFKYDEENSMKTSELVSILDEYHEMSRERVSTDHLFEYEPGNGKFANKLLLCIPSLVGGMNILACRLTDAGDIVAGSTQGLLSILPLKTPLPTDETELSIPSEITLHSAGLIALDVHPTNRDLVLTGSMDRKCKLINLSKEEEGYIVQIFENHKKFVVKVRWSSSGKYFATASYDQTVCIYREKFAEEKLTYELWKQLSFKGQVEGITFRKNTDMLIVSVRNDNNFHIIDTTSEDPKEVQHINMNLLGDDHVSFTAMDISCSPDDNFILVSTDRDRLILFDLRIGKQVANFYGSINDEYSQSRNCWHPTGQYIYSTSQDKCIVVWEVASQKLVTKLQGHTGIVRDLWYNEPLSVLVSCGFDGSIRLWHN